MTDSHIRLLAAVARFRDRETEEYQSSVDPSAAGEAARSHRAARARKQLSAARARRRLATGHERDS
jgi:hypothetical protein